MIAPICVVLNNDKAAAWTEITLEKLYNLIFLLIEMQSIGHNQAVERWQLDWLAKISLQVMGLQIRIATVHYLLLPLQALLILIHRIDFTIRPQEFGQG